MIDMENLIPIVLVLVRSTAEKDLLLKSKNKKINFGLPSLRKYSEAYKQASFYRSEASKVFQKPS